MEGMKALISLMKHYVAKLLKKCIKAKVRRSKVSLVHSLALLLFCPFHPVLFKGITACINCIFYRLRYQ